MPDLTEGTELAGRYTLLRREGAGGMGETWKASDRRADKPVALKFLAAGLAAKPAARERFHDEWRLASRLMHAHILRVFEYHDESDDEPPFYAMQYLDGPSLAELAGQPLDRLLRPVGLLADALRYAHGKHIVHGDVTAANVRMDGRGAPYLIDFGVASEAGAGAGGGTPAALSPQRRAGEAAEAADDVYSLGVLLHELLFGAPPEADGIPRTTSAGETVPSAIRDLLGRMLAAERADRPDAASVGRALADAGFPPGAAVLPGGRRRVADDAEVEVARVRPSRPHAAGRQAAPAPGLEKHGIPAPVVAGGLAVLVAALLAVLFVLPPGDEPREPAEPQPVAGTSPADEAPGEADGADAGEPAAPVATSTGEEPAAFSENRATDDGSIKAATDEALGDLLSRLERLRYRGIERWGGEAYDAALARYAEGDKAYVAKDFAAAREHYRATIEMLDPFFDRIDETFRETMQAARSAFDARDHREAIRLYDLAVAITPGNEAAERGLERARSLEDVLGLMRQGREYESELAYDAALEAYRGALELDPLWQPAEEGVARVEDALEQLRFEQLMTDGFDALAAENFESARAAFEAARNMRPSSGQPVDGLLQVDQQVRLATIRELEEAAAEHERNERWEAAVADYEEALNVDPDLAFAKEGLARAQRRAAIHRQIEEYIAEPDSLSAPAVMQRATDLLLSLNRIEPAGPRLEDQKETLARLLKRAATPLTVELRSDNQTDVSIYRVGNLGTFDQTALSLRPGSYVAVGSRPGFRDVRLEFRVAPELEMDPIVVQCEERI